MAFKDDLKFKNYFTKDYTKEEVLKTFKRIIGRFERTGEMEGKLEDIKIVQISGKVITVETKMKDSNDIRLYRMSLEFPQMENEEFSREAKIASPERIGKIIELNIEGNDKKIQYFEEKVDYWRNQEDISQDIEDTINVNKFIEKYGKDNIKILVMTILGNSSKSGDILGKIQSYKIVEIGETDISVAVKTEDDKKVRIYRINLDLDKIKNIGYSDKAKANSVTRKGSTIELQSSMKEEEKIEYYNNLPNIFGKSEEEQAKDKAEE